MHITVRSYDFANASYDNSVTGFIATHNASNGLEDITLTGPDEFTGGIDATSGSLDGQALWSNPYNWQSGTTPVSGGSVVLNADGVDDLGPLSLTSLTEEPGADLFYIAGSSLSIATLDVSANSELYSGILGVSTPVTVTISSIVGSGSILGAVGGTFIDLSTSDPGEHYFAGYGGSVTLHAAPASGSILEFGGGYTDTISLESLPTGIEGATLEGLAVGDVLELPGSSVSSVTFGAGTLTITTSAGAFDFINVQYTQPVTGYTATQDPTTGLENITFTAAACYRRGTRIRTSRGDVRIEDIKVGDEVATLSGANRVVRWLGRRAIDCSAYADPIVVWPICIKAEALAPGVPVRDLWVSPGHSLYIDGVLIQAEKLVNGATIVRVPQTRLEYWHVELDSHDIVLAEGAPSESYLDTGKRLPQVLYTWLAHSN